MLLPVLGIKVTGGENEDSPGSSGRCPLTQEMWLEPQEGVWSSGRSGQPTAAPMESEGMTLSLPAGLLGHKTFPPTGSGKLGRRPSPGTWRGPRGPPSSKITWPHLPPTYPPAGTFLANSIFAPLGSSVEIKRLFAVTNVANSDQTI